MQINLHKSNNRGFADYGEVKSFHSFNFAGYFNPLREKFGVIRVINDEILSPGGILEMSDQKNLELLIFLLKGSVTICISENSELIQENQIQYISAGAGVDLKIKNNDNKSSAELLQIWLFPNIKNTSPLWSRLDYSFVDNPDSLIKIAAPTLTNNCFDLKQDAFISILNLRKESNLQYHLQRNVNLILIFVIKGRVLLSEEGKESETLTVAERDSAEISSIGGYLNLSGECDSQLLLIETPVD